MKPTAPTRWLKISNLVAGRNPRGTDFEVDDLVESFGTTPLLHNVVVRRVGSSEKFEIIAGHRRVEAAKQKGWAQVEAKIVEVDDETAEVMMLEENLRRKSLPDEVSALARLVELYEQRSPSRRGGDHSSKKFKAKRQAGALPVGGLARAAEVAGLSVRDTQRKVRVAKLATAKVKKALSDGQVNVLEVEKLVVLPKGQQDRQLKALVKIKAELPPDLRRVLEALKYVEENLRKKRTGGIAKTTLVELQALAKSVVTVLSALASTRSRRSTRKALAAKTVSLKPKGNVADAVSFEPKSYNKKLSTVGSIAAADRPRPMPMKPYVCATTLSIQTSCPDSCCFKSVPGAPGGCYADAGFTRIKIQKLDEAAKGFTSTDLIREEVRRIDSAFGGGRIPQDGARGGRDLRLHVAGDVQTTAEAKLLGAAATRWSQRGGGETWTFTHSWREVPRSAWGRNVSVLASVEHPRDMLLARQQGYASAVVVEEFGNGERAFQLEGAKKFRVIPCPAETRGTNCAACRLCLRPDALLKTKAVIAFKIHGQHAGRAVAAVKQALTTR